MAIAFPISDTAPVIFDDWLEVVDYMQENGNVEAITHIAEQLGVDVEAEPIVQKYQLATVLNRVAKLYEAGGLVESLDERA